MLAMPLTIVGATFNEEWENMEHSKVEVVPPSLVNTTQPTTQN